MRRILILVLALVGVGAACGSDGEVMGAPAPEASAADSGGTSEGIQVHGDWVITVVDRDGTLVEEREFANELQGASLLVDVLTRQKDVQSWSIYLRGPSSGQGPCDGRCELREPGFPASFGDTDSESITVTDLGASFQIAGSVSATSDAPITHVWTVLTPTAGASGTFTLKNPLPGGQVDVLAGQEVLVTVTISFS